MHQEYRQERCPDRRNPECQESDIRQGFGAGSSLQLFFITLNGKFTTVVEKVICLICHTLLGKALAEYLKVACLENTGVFVDLMEIRINTVLTDLMGDNRYLRHENLCVLGCLYLLDTGTVLDLNFCCVITAVCACVCWQNCFIVILAGGRFCGLNVAERCIAHTIGTTEKSVLAQTDTNKEILLRKNDRCMLEVVGTLCI